MWCKLSAKGQNPLHQFPHSKSVTSWQLPRCVANKSATYIMTSLQQVGAGKIPLCLLCCVVSQIPLQRLVASWQLSRLRVSYGETCLMDFGLKEREISASLWAKWLRKNVSASTVVFLLFFRRFLSCFIQGWFWEGVAPPPIEMSGSPVAPHSVRLHCAMFVLVTGLCLAFSDADIEFYCSDKFLLQYLCDCEILCFNDHCIQLILEGQL